MMTETTCYFRFNALFATELTRYQPISEEPKVTLNSLRYRGLDGFVAAVSPFNFTAIGGNLAYTPALMVIVYFMTRLILHLSGSSNIYEYIM